MHDSLINALSEISAYQNIRPAITSTGTQALHRLIPVALSRTATGKTIGRFLLGLYDGTTYRFALKDFHELSVLEFEDCMRVLEMDYMPEVEVHNRVDEGDSVWRELAALWRNEPLEFTSLRPAGEHEQKLCIKNRGAIEVRGIEAFDRLLQVAERSTGQSRIVGKFLMSLIQQNEYRLNLNDLRGVEIKVFGDCLSVMRMDYITDIEATKP